MGFGPERERQDADHYELEAIWRMEEMNANQRSWDKNIKEGDKNTAYDFAVANQHNRDKRVIGLEGLEGWIEDNGKLLDHALDFYKSLFDQEKSSSVRDEGF